MTDTARTPEKSPTPLTLKYPQVALAIKYASLDGHRQKRLADQVCDVITTTEIENIIARLEPHLREVPPPPSPRL